MNASATLRSPVAILGSLVFAIALAIGVSTQFGFADAPPSSGAVFVPIEPVRVLDTRDDLGLTGAFGSEQPRDLKLGGGVPSTDGIFELPASASAVALNVTAVLPTHAGFLSVRPGGAEGAPETSNLNFVAGDVVPNKVDTKLGDDGSIQIWVKTDDPAGTAHVLVDVVGYFDGHDHDDRYYPKAKVDGKINDVQVSVDAATQTMSTVQAQVAANADAIDSLDAPITTNADAIEELEGRVAANEEAINALEAAGGSEPTVVEVNRRIVNASYTTQSIELYPGLDLDLVCTGGGSPQPHIGWDAGSDEMTVWSGTSASPATYTFNTIWPGASDSVGFDVQMLGTIGGSVVQANVVVHASSDAANTCDFVGTATVTAFALPD